MKVCSKCGIEKEYSEFYKKKGSKDGYREACKKCINEKSKENYKLSKSKKIEWSAKYYKKNKEKVNERKKKYRESNKNNIKEYLELNKDKISEQKKRYFQLNKDKFKKSKHKRRALKSQNGGSYTTKQWEECLNYFNNECAYTGKPLDNEVLHVEHIQAISKGGTSYIWNLCPSIASANLSKSNKELEEWYKQQGYYSEERLNKIYEWQDYAFNKYKELEEVV